MSNSSNKINRGSQKRSDSRASIPKQVRSKPSKIKASRRPMAEVIRQNRRDEAERSSVRAGILPVAQTNVRELFPANVQNHNNGDVTVTHMEYLQDISGSIGFSTNTVAINPGQSASFPWLSLMAPLFESYQFEELEFEFQTMQGSTALGTVMAAVDYDASDAAPLSKQQLSAYRGYVRSAPWFDFCQRSKLSDLRKQKSYYVRPGALPANTDIKMYDTGNLFLATQGQADTSVVGELYVRYKVRLMTPQLGNVAVGLSKSAKFNVNAGGNGPFAGSNAPLNPSGTGAGGTVSYTATAPYAAILAASGTGTAPVITTTGSTATLDNVVSTVNGTAWQYAAQVTFSPGQIFTFNLAGGAFVGTFSFGQFNTPEIP